MCPYVLVIKRIFLGLVLNGCSGSASAYEFLDACFWHARAHTRTHLTQVKEPQPPVVAIAFPFLTWLFSSVKTLTIPSAVNNTDMGVFCKAYDLCECGLDS